MVWLVSRWERKYLTKLTSYACGSRLIFNQHRAKLCYNRSWFDTWFRFRLEDRFCCYGCVRHTLDIDRVRQLCDLACMPVVVSTGYIRLVSRISAIPIYAAQLCCRQRVVVLKDQTNKKAHEESAQVACEAAGAIRTVASLTREDDCSRVYSESLEGPLRQSNRSALWSNTLFAFSQGVTYVLCSLCQPFLAYCSDPFQIFCHCSCVLVWLASCVKFAMQQLPLLYCAYGTCLSLQSHTIWNHFSLQSSVFGAIQAGNVFAFVPDISSAKSAGSDIIKLIDSRPEIDAESTEGKIVSTEKVRGQIRLENIHFRYPTRPAVRVLRDLSLKVEPGTYIALVGASGSGKSTV